MLGGIGAAGELTQVARGVWCVRSAARGRGGSCSYLVAGGGGIVAIDPGPGAAAMAAVLATLGHEPAGVTAVLLTHARCGRGAHGPAAGAAALKALTGARLYSHPAEAAGGVAPDVPVGDGDLVAGAFRVVATPGHSRGHVCWFHEPTGTLFAGHALRVAGGELHLGARPAPADVPAARRAIARCLELPIEHICPGRREPLSVSAGAQALAMRSRILTGARWPLLG